MHVLSTNWFRGDSPNPLMIDSISQSLLVPMCFLPFYASFAIESYFLFIIELWPPECHGAPDARKVPLVLPTWKRFLLFTYIVNIQRSMWNSPHTPSRCVSFSGLYSSPRSAFLCAYVKYRMKFPSVDSNINQTLRHIVEGRADCYMYIWMGKVPDGPRLLLCLYCGLFLNYIYIYIFLFYFLRYIKDRISFRIF
jgi:hypothetical protein